MWPVIQLSSQQQIACGLPAEKSARKGCLSIPNLHSVYSNIGTPVESFHIGCSSSGKCICTCAAVKRACLQPKINLSLLENRFKVLKSQSYSASALSDRYKHDGIQHLVSQSTLEIDAELEFWRARCLSCDLHEEITPYVGGYLPDSINETPKVAYKFVPHDYPMNIFSALQCEEERTITPRHWPPRDVGYDRKRKLGKVGRKRRQPDFLPVSTADASPNVVERKCSFCATLQSPLWRLIHKEGDTYRKAQNTARQVEDEVHQPVMVVSCNPCYIKWDNDSGLKETESLKKRKEVCQSQTMDIVSNRVHIDSHEAELRLRKQFCPICDIVYEDNDSSSFIFCDSCEMWIHSACVPSLTP